MVSDIVFPTKGLYPLIAPDMIEVQGFLNDGSNWTNGDTSTTSSTVPPNGLILFQGNVGENTDQPNSCEPNVGLTKRLCLPIQPNPASLATCLWDKWPSCLSQSIT